MPTLHAAVLCDSAHKEFGTGKWILVGTWTIVHALAVPVLHPSCALYLCISDANGDYDMELQLVHLGEEERVLARSAAYETHLATHAEQVRQELARTLADLSAAIARGQWVDELTPPPIEKIEIQTTYLKDKSA